jgi:hypothetical protein
MNKFLTALATVVAAVLFVGCGTPTPAPAPAPEVTADPELLKLQEFQKRAEALQKESEEFRRIVATNLEVLAESVGKIQPLP